MSINIFREERPNDNFTIIRNEIIYDSSISMDARLVLIYLLSKPDTWRLCKKDLINLTKDATRKSGRHAIDAIVNELCAAGHLAKDSSSEANQPRYFVFECKERGLEYSKKFSADKQHVGCGLPTQGVLITDTGGADYRHLVITDKQVLKNKNLYKEIYKEKNESFPEEQKKTSSTELVEVKNASGSDLKADLAAHNARVVSEHQNNVARLLEMGCDKSDLEDWIICRKKKKKLEWHITDRAMKSFLSSCKAADAPVNLVVKECADRNWFGFLTHYSLSFKPSTNTYGNSRHISPYWAKQEADKRKEEEWQNEITDGSDLNIIDV